MPLAWSDSATALVDRPHPGRSGARRDPDAWPDADLRFDRDGGWSGPGADAGPWTVDGRGRDPGAAADRRRPGRPVPGARRDAAVARARVAERRRRRATDPPAVLHLFAYTGLATLAMAAPGRAVTHVDASRPTVAWARDNAERRRPGRPAGPLDRRRRPGVRRARGPPRAALRRLVLDPPSYGHGADGAAVAARDGPRRRCWLTARAPRAGRVRPADRPHAEARWPTTCARPSARGDAAGPRRTVETRRARPRHGRRAPPGARVRSPE